MRDSGAPSILPDFIRTCEKAPSRRDCEKIVGILAVPLDHTLLIDSPVYIGSFLDLGPQAREIKAKRIFSGVQTNTLTTLRHLVLNS